jgi:regulator of protease activity HflC (stomatin/prohibitin superfamily)
MRSHQLLSITLRNKNQGIRNFATQRNSSFSASLPPPIGFVMVPQQRAYVVERFGKFLEVLQPGLHFMIPFIDRVAYVHSLKEEAIPILSQQAITRDNVTIGIDGVLYVRVIDAYAASYGVEDPIFAVSQIAQTTMRSELGRMKLDETFEERENLNQGIVNAINTAAKPWGLTCLRYEIRDITPPPSVRLAMDTQAEAERRKRAEILQSEGERQSEMNRAEGERSAAIMRAEAESETIRRVAIATAEGIRIVAQAQSTPGGREATGLRVAEKYIEAFSQLAKQGNTIIVPANVSDAGGMIAQAMAVYSAMNKNSTPLNTETPSFAQVPSIRQVLDDKKEEE